MCNHYRADPNWVARTGEFSHLKIPLRFPATPGNYRPPEHIYPGRDGTVFRLSEDGQALEPAIMRWGLIPLWHRKSVKEWKLQCNNCRSEEMATKATFKSALAKRRCLVPAAAFYESQGRGTKMEWEITRGDGRPFLFAGLWDHAETADGPVDSYTILTSAPGPDMLQWHDRQLIQLEPDQVEAWLDPTAPYDDIISTPIEAGVLQAVGTPLGRPETMTPAPV
jgi:putative SOS response-associated peptidase YedK